MRFGRVLIAICVGCFGTFVLPFVLSAATCIREGKFSISQITSLGFAMLIPLALLSLWKEALAGKLLMLAGSLAIVGLVFDRSCWILSNRTNTKIGLVLYFGIIAVGWWLTADARKARNPWINI
jgi:hypothetical protein